MNALNTSTISGGRCFQFHILMKYRYSYSSYTPWPDDLYCEEYSVEFSTEKPLPLIGLASFPRSGNTWLRYLIAGAVGIFTGSFYNSGCMISQGKRSKLNYLYDKLCLNY